MAHTDDAKHNFIVNHLGNNLRWTDHLGITIAVDWDIKNQSKQN